MFLKKNTASQVVTFGLVNASTGAALTGATVTVRRCLDGTFAAVTGTVTEDSGGYYKFAPSQADTNGDQVGYYFTATNAIPVCLNLRTTAADMADTVRFGLTALPNVASGSAGAIITSGTGTAQLSTSSGLVTLAGVTHTGAVIPTVTTTTTATNVTTVNGLAANVITATSIASDAITAAKIADGAIDRATFAADTGFQSVRSSTAQAGGATSITLDASASATTDFYKGQTVYLTGGTGVGQNRIVTAYNGTTKVATVTPAWATNPDNTSTFAVRAAGAADVVSLRGTASAGAAGYAGIDWANVTAPTTTLNLSGTTISTTQAVASVSGSVGSVTGAVGSVTGNVGGNVVGSVASVTGNVGGNVTGSVGSVTGAVGSVTARVTANTDQLAGQTVTAAAGVTFPTSVASPTNITAGTITTVTNLTNLPTIPANWLTAAGTAADFGAEIADAVWDEVISGHLTGGTTGNALNSAGSAGDPWGTTLPGAYSAGSAGYIVGNNLNATVSSRLASASYTAPLDAAGTRSAVGLASANLDTQLGDIPTNSELATAITTALTTALTEGYRSTGATGSVRDLLYEVIAHLGESSISGTTKTIKKINGSTTAKTYTLDSATVPTSISETT